MSSEQKNLRFVHVLHELFVNFAEEFDVILDLLAHALTMLDLAVKSDAFALKFLPTHQKVLSSFSPHQVQGSTRVSATKPRQANKAG